LRRSRYIGLMQVHLGHILKAVGLNVLRGSASGGWRPRMPIRALPPPSHPDAGMHRVGWLRAHNGTSHIARAGVGHYNTCPMMPSIPEQTWQVLGEGLRRGPRRDGWESGYAQRTRGATGWLPRYRGAATERQLRQPRVITPGAAGYLIDDRVPPNFPACSGVWSLGGAV
jgi:hypothetical protein